jgi:hypothetical protein
MSWNRSRGHLKIKALKEVTVVIVIVIAGVTVEKFLNVHWSAARTM